MSYTNGLDNPELYFQCKLYTGNGTAIGSGGLAVTLDGSEDMSPSLVWIKERNSSVNHQIYDSARGATYRMYPDGSYDEDQQTEGITAFNSNGFTIGNDANTNGSSDTYVAWCWKGGTTSGIAGSADITPNAYSFNQTSGFSCLTYNGTDVNGDTVLHGLGAVPHFMIVKRRVTGDGYDWVVYHKDDVAGLYLNTDDNNADSSSTNIWFHGQTPTSTQFHIGTDGRIGDNVATGAYVFYGWAGIQGYSKFGSWIGTGGDGPFIFTGFRPAFILRKEVSNDDVWIINDTKRSPINFDTSAVPLYPHTSGAEPGGVNFDILSNGFKIRNTDGDTNTADATFIYAAFAEAPFVNSKGVPCNAR